MSVSTYLKPGRGTGALGGHAARDAGRRIPQGAWPGSQHRDWHCAAVAARLGNACGTQVQGDNRDFGGRYD